MSPVNWTYPTVHTCMHRYGGGIKNHSNDDDVHQIIRRYGFQVAGSLFVFVLFWILLVKVNRSLNMDNLDPTDQRVFWVNK